MRFARTGGHVGLVCIVPNDAGLEYHNVSFRHVGDVPMAADLSRRLALYSAEVPERLMVIQHKPQRARPTSGRRICMGRGGFVMHGPAKQLVVGPTTCRATPTGQRDNGTDNRNGAQENRFPPFEDFEHGTLLSPPILSRPCCMNFLHGRSSH